VTGNEIFFSHHSSPPLNLKWAGDGDESVSFFLSWITGPCHPFLIPHDNTYFYLTIEGFDNKAFS
jgi:hypothetical protein